MTTAIEGRERTTVGSQYVGIFIDLWQSTPVFHAWNFNTVGTDSEETICGQQVAPPVPRHRRVNVIPMRHALKIGRPCRLCFEEER